MTDKKQAQRPTQTEENKSILIFGIVRVIDKFGPLIDKNGFRLFKTDAMLPGV